MSDQDFTELVSQALDGLPEQIADQMSNVEIIVEDRPGADIDGGDGLLGLYEGIPLTERDAGYWGVLPDRITLFRANLERAGGDAEGIKEMVRTTVIHEVAHHFGIDDDRLDELGWA